MQSTDRPLIVGAGPVGLAAAVFLARAGITARVVETKREASTQSKALAVNPRTLEILDPVGARGMNLGIEDAWYLAQLVQRGQLSRYSDVLHLIDRGVVHQVEIFSRIVACEPRIMSLPRRLLPLLLRLGLPTSRMLAIITGTGHPLGEFEPSRHKTAT